MRGTRSETEVNPFPPTSLRPPTELDRICALPILDPNWQAPDQTHLYRRPGGFQTLRPSQSKGLAYASLYRGLFALMDVGAGKTLLSLLIPLAVNAQRPLLLIPPTQRADLRAQWQKYANHWRLPTRLEVKTYDLLSQPDATAMLQHLRPDAIICDEAHKLADRKSTRTRRFMRYMEEHSEVMFFAMSGSFSTRSVEEYAHLIACALGRNSPLPINSYTELKDFAQALDVFRNTRVQLELDADDDLGFEDLIEETTSVRGQARQRLQPLCKLFRTDNVREAYRLRLISCPGVVYTPEASVNIPVEITCRTNVAIPASVQAALQTLAEWWVTPSGEELEDGLAYNRARRQLSGGMFYRWVWPEGKPDEAERLWLDCRAGWHRALRQWLPRSQIGRDSPALTERTAEREPRLLPGYVLEAWYKWRPLKDRPEPPQEAVWLDPFLVYDAVAWAQAQREPVLIWYDETAIGQAIAQVGGYRFADVGPEADQMLADLKQAETLVLSIKAHGTGKNLQLWKNQIVASPPANGRAWQQLIGRTRRPGQTADVIRVTYYGHTDVFAASMRNAREEARYIEQTKGTPQILNQARFFVD